MYLQWSFFAEATFARPLGEIVNHRREFHPELSECIAEMQRRAIVSLGAIDEELNRSEHAFLLGKDFSGADIMTGYAVFLCCALAPPEPGRFPAAEAYWAKLKVEYPICLISLIVHSY